MEKNIMRFALAMKTIASVIDLTIYDGRVEFKAHKSVVTNCLNIAFMYDMNVSVYSVKNGYYQMEAHLNKSIGSYEDINKHSEG